MKPVFITILALPALAMEAPVQAVLEDRCIDCHDAALEKGGLDLETLAFDPQDPENLRLWVRLHDRVESGEMPPADEDPLPEDEKARLLNWLDRSIAAAQTEQRAGFRTRTRRLNRDQFLASLDHLLGPSDLPDLLPEEPPHGVMDTEDRVLGISAAHLSRFIRASRVAVKTAVGRAVDSAPPATWTFSALDLISRVNTPAKPEFFAIRECDDAVEFRSWFGGFNHGNIAGDRFMAPAAGWYRVTVEASAVDSQEVVPFRLVTRLPGDPFSADHVDYRDAVPGETRTFEFWVRTAPGRNFRLELAESILPSNDEGRQGNQSHALRPDFIGPGVRFGDIEIQGPFAHPPDKAPPVLMSLLRDGPEWRSPAGVEAVLKDFAPHAFRRSRDEAEALAAPALDAARSAFAEGHPPQEALALGLRVMLSSVHFLLIQEKPGPLDEHALATRLAFFLSGGPPDAELLAAAESATLRQPTMLLAHARRLLDGPPGETFFQRFADQWLELDHIDATKPDAQLYPEFDNHLKRSSVRESELTLAAMFRDNLPATTLVASDQVIANVRLAAHYGLERPAGEDFRPLRLPPGSWRGGLITQASVLKVSANGTTTSPILRGVWMLNNLLDQPPPPPPPGVAAVEPDTRGAANIREQLEKHRASSSCAACHAKIDPLGFALESFDVIGGQRQTYRAVTDDWDPKRPALPGFRAGLPVDPSGRLPDGKSFADWPELRDALLADPDRLAAALLRKLTAYATAHPVEFVDRPEIDRILSRTRATGHGCRDLLENLLLSPLFLGGESARSLSPTDTP